MVCRPSDLLRDLLVVVGQIARASCLPLYVYHSKRYVSFPHADFGPKAALILSMRKDEIRTGLC
jgi:hypothetical protein